MSSFIQRVMIIDCTALGHRVNTAPCTVHPCHQVLTRPTPSHCGCGSINLRCGLLLPHTPSLLSHLHSSSSPSRTTALAPTSRIRSPRTTPASRRPRPRRILFHHHRLHNLPHRVEHNIHQRIQWRIRVSLLYIPSTQRLTHPSVGHVSEVIADDLTGGGACGAYDLLDDVAQVINKEIESSALLSDGAYEAIDLTHYIIDNGGDIIDSGDEEWVEVE